MLLTALSTAVGVILLAVFVIGAWCWRLSQTLDLADWCTKRELAGIASSWNVEHSRLMKRLEEIPAERETRIARVEMDVEDCVLRVQRLTGRMARQKQLDDPKPTVQHVETPEAIKQRLRAQVGLVPRANGGD